MPTFNAYGFQLPAIDDQLDIPGDLRRLADSIGPYVIQMYDSVADRDARIPAPTEGMTAWLRDTNIMTRYNGSAWFIESYGYALPSPQTNQYDNNGNEISQTSTWAAMPNSPNVSMTNSNPHYELEVRVDYSAWLVTTGQAVRAQIISTDGWWSTQLPWGNVLYLGNVGGATVQCSATFSALVTRVSTANFSWQARRDNTSGVNQVNYPSITVTPLRYI